MLTVSQEFDRRECRGEGSLLNIVSVIGSWCVVNRYLVMVGQVVNLR